MSRGFLFTAGRAFSHLNLPPLNKQILTVSKMILTVVS